MTAGAVRRACDLAECAGRAPSTGSVRFAAGAQPADLLLQVVEQAWVDASPAAARA